MPLQVLVLELTPVSDVDTTGIHALFEMLRFMKSEQVSGERRVRTVVFLGSESTCQMVMCNPN